MNPLLDADSSKIAHLDMLFQNGTILQKRKIISRLFPDNPTFEGLKFFYARINVAIALLSKNRKNPKNRSNNRSYRESNRERSFEQKALNVYFKKNRVVCHSVSGNLATVFPFSRSLTK